ncbi:MAG TPA: tRNA epoxyqueuosine(34) reductase QueG [Bacteroidales bacterium]|jgi:epoxyqueuosine reductase|nr:tRNA epoxyqueuosine(34) reductase QueG [Bacteroidales bacterium]
MDIIRSNTNKIRQKALELGFSAIGFSKANFLEKESKQLKEWLVNGFQGEMQYMENNFEKRTDPGKLVEGAKSVISVLLNYSPEEQQIEDSYKISKYAYGKDYHFVVKEKLQILLEFINKEIKNVSGRAFVDSAPVMDKVWAAKSGLGWIGKNTNLISKEFGSFFFIGELIVDIELGYDTSPDSYLGKDYCGTCTRCIDACPTNALTPYQLDARKCISYLTIEKKGEIPFEFKGKWNDWIFGCDICQDVCPWNTNRKPHSEPQFKITKQLKNLTKDDWQNIDKLNFKKLFKNSPIERTKFEGLKRNIDFIKKPLANS